MSVAAARPAPLSTQTRRTAALHSVPLLCAIGLLLTLAISWPSVAEVWRTGAFANTDDAMRLVEVRDWLAGQPWFDLHQYRLDPPAGVQMHWTRVLDVPLGLLIRLFSSFLPVEQAERLTRIVFPLALHVGLFGAVAALARRLAGPVAMLPAVIIAALSGGVLVQFQPGRIHHHSTQILLVVLILWASVRAVEARRAWPAAAAGALAALSLSINIENLTYIFVEIAAFGLSFVVLGERFRAALFGFAASLAISSLAAFVATIGPSRYFIGACDAFSTAHLFAIFLTAAAFCSLAALSPRLRAPIARLIGCVLGGAAVLIGVALVYPACLHDPQAGVDPLLRKLWLDHVEEARPLAALIVAHPSKFLTLALAPLLGLGGALIAAWREKGAARVGWLIVSAFAAIGLITAMWQVRALSSAAAVALFGGAWLVARAIQWSVGRPGLLAAFAPFAAGLPFCSLVWALVTPAQAQSDAVAGRLTCRTPAAVGALAALPRSLLMAPIDMGSDILADTRHSVLAAPYHRNNHGNRTLVDAMMARPDAARKIVRDSGAAYVVFCPAMPELAIYAAASPDSLASALLADAPPAWLNETPIAGSPYRVYKVQ